VFLKNYNLAEELIDEIKMVDEIININNVK